MKIISMLRISSRNYFRIHSDLTEQASTKHRRRRPSLGRGGFESLRARPQTQSRNKWRKATRRLHSRQPGLARHLPPLHARNTSSGFTSLMANILLNGARVWHCQDPDPIGGQHRIPKLCGFQYKAIFP